MPAGTTPAEVSSAPAQESSPWPSPEDGSARVQDQEEIEKSLQIISPGLSVASNLARRRKLSVEFHAQGKAQRRTLGPEQLRDHMQRELGEIPSLFEWAHAPHGPCLWLRGPGGPGMA